MALSIPQETVNIHTAHLPAYSGENTGALDIVLGSGKTVFPMQHSVIEPGLESWS